MPLFKASHEFHGLTMNQVRWFIDTMGYRAVGLEWREDKGEAFVECKVDSTVPPDILIADHVEHTVVCIY